MGEGFREQLMGAGNGVGEGLGAVNGEGEELGGS